MRCYPPIQFLEGSCPAPYPTGARYPTTKILPILTRPGCTENSHVICSSATICP